MSTQHRDNSVVADDKNKPEIITYYNNTKSGVDILDSVRIRANVRQPLWPWRFFSIWWILLHTTHWCCGLRWIQTGIKASHTPGACFCVNLAWVWQMTMLQNVSLITLANGYASKRALVGILSDRPSSTSSKSSSDGRRRWCNACPRQPERKTTRSCHTCKQHSMVLMTCLECAEGLDHRPPYQQPHQMTVAAAERPDWHRVLWRNSACIYF